MVTDFKETLEVKKNSKCFLSYSYRWTKTDLTFNDVLETKSGSELSLNEVDSLIDDFSENAAQCAAALQTLQNNGKVTMVSEY